MALPLLYFLEQRRRVESSESHAAELALMLGQCHLRLGQLRRAEEAFVQALSRAGNADPWTTLRAHLLLAEVLVVAHHYPRATASVDAAEAVLREHPEPQLQAQAWLLRADLARMQGDHPQAAQLVERAAASAAGADQPSLAGRVALARAQVAWARGLIQETAEALRTAVDVLEAAGIKHLLAEVFLQCGAFIGEAETDDERDPSSPLPLPAAHYLARAQELFAESGSLRDLERLRHHFRLYGRRATDKVADEIIAKRAEEVFLGQLEFARRVDALLPTLAALERNDEAAPDPRVDAIWSELVGFYSELHTRQVALSRGTDRLVAAAHAAVVERDHLRKVLDGVRRLNTDLERDQLTREVVKLAAYVVDADRVVLALVSRTGELTSREELGMSAGGDYTWRFLAEQTRRTGKALLSGEDPNGLSAGPAPEAVERPELGQAMAVPIRQGHQVHGVIYADRQPRGGVFSRRELGLLEVVAAQVGTLLERQRMNWALHMSARIRETTMEAITDGVVAISLLGEIRSANSAACRLFRQPKHEVEGSLLSSIRTPGDLFVDLERPEELDGRMVRLPGGEAMLGARIVRDDSGNAAGTVLTFTGLKRAQRTAQRIVGARARYTFSDIIGVAPDFQEAMHLARAAARSDSGMLITGESGTGKEVMAQAVHNASNRSAGPFVGINCAAIPRDLLESELFGYEEGAFTGAKRGGQPGKFELAEGGTILLDEIGDMPLEMQVKLLRVLQERRFQRVGGHREFVLDARIVATTNRDLEELAGEGRFRSDLLFRLQVIHLILPPLRERKEDIPVFVEHFLRRSAERLGKRVCRVSPLVMEAFVDYAWPGNIRELEYIVESEVNLADPDAEELDRMPAALRPARRRRRETLVGLPMADDKKGQRISSGTYNLKDAEQEIFVAALREHRGNVPAIAKSLGVSRGTVYNKIRKFGLELDDYRNG